MGCNKPPFSPVVGGILCVFPRQAKSRSYPSSRSLPKLVLVFPYSFFLVASISLSVWGVCCFSFALHVQTISVSFPSPHPSFLSFLSFSLLRYCGLYLRGLFLKFYVGTFGGMHSVFCYHWNTGAMFRYHRALLAQLSDKWYKIGLPRVEVATLI